jgi:uncharacterized protein (TIGR02186 family)
MKQTLIFFLFLFLNNFTVASEAYFDLSQKEIQIETDFNGKEIIVFGIFQKDEDTILTIQGPKKDTKVLKKERLAGFWINTKQVIYKQLPTLFFIASSSPIKDILNYETIIKEKLHFDELLINTITQRNFTEQKNLDIWTNNLIKIKKNENLYKELDFNNIDNKLFQTRVFFPENSIPGEYKVSIYQVKNNIIQSKKDRVINIKKSGIGEKIYKFAHQESAAYGLLSILFAILSGLLAATIFRKI